MKDKPEVSAVIIFYNAGRFIEEAITSVFEQTCTAWELLLVDDGSTDNSTRIAQRWAERYPKKIRYLEHENHQNQGMSTSRNLGLTEANGEYVAFLDSDDIWLPNKLERQLEILATRPEVVMTYGPTRYWYSWTGNRADKEQDFYGTIGVEANSQLEAPRLLQLYLETSGAILPGICSILVRRDAAQQVGNFEENFRGSYEDQVFLSKICLDYPVFVTDECTDYYRQHPDSCSYLGIEAGSYNPNLPHRTRHAYLRWLADYLVVKEIENEALSTALKKELRPYRYPIPYDIIGRIVNRLSNVNRHLKERLGIYPQKEDDDYVPPPGQVKFGHLRRLQPISREYGYDRGTPVDRYYIENFLRRHKQDIRGRVLEIGDNDYSLRFGSERVQQSDVLHVHDKNPLATIIGDLTNAEHIPSDAFDCFVFTQTLQLIYDIRAALSTINRILKPDGVVLATFPGISQISNDEWGTQWYWSFTSLSAKTLFEEFFPAENISIETHGNVLATSAFLQGLATEELDPVHLDMWDPQYEMLITLRAVKPGPSYYKDMRGRWDYTDAKMSAYDEETSYKKGIAFLDGHGDIEDWGCGTAYAKKFVTQSRYIGIDGSKSEYCDRVAELQEYRSATDCIFMRHVLEHNPNWRVILDNAVSSFKKRMVLIIFTPFTVETGKLADRAGMVDMSFKKEDLIQCFGCCRYTEETIKSATEYGSEHLFYLKNHDSR